MKMEMDFRSIKEKVEETTEEWWTQSKLTIEKIVIIGKVGKVMMLLELMEW